MKQLTEIDARRRVGKPQHPDLPRGARRRTVADGRIAAGLKESIPVDWEALARACAHPLRISILEILGIDGGRTLSPSELSHELQIPLGNTNYHVIELYKADLIVLVDEKPVRGATEHFYRLHPVG